MSAASGRFPDDKLTPVAGLRVQFDTAELARILYIDHYGNAWTGIRGGGLVEPGSYLEVQGLALPWRGVFMEAGKGEAFWYVNSSGLIEVAVNRGSAALRLGLKLGDPVGLPQTPGSHHH